MKTFHYFLSVLAVTILICIASNTLHAQTPCTFLYDDAGNRVERVIDLTQKSASLATSIANVEIEEDLPTKITIYPNPTKGLMKIQTSGFDPGQLFHITIYNLQGMLVFQQETSNILSEVNLTGKPAGTYIMQIRFNNKSEQWKIIKD